MLQAEEAWLGYVGSYHGHAGRGLASLATAALLRLKKASPADVVEVRQPIMRQLDALQPTCCSSNQQSTCKTTGVPCSAGSICQMSGHPAYSSGTARHSCSVRVPADTRARHQSSVQMTHSCATPSAAAQAHVYALMACYERTEAPSAEREDGAYHHLCAHLAGLHGGAAAPAADSALSLLKGLLDYAFQVLPACVLTISSCHSLSRSVGADGERGPIAQPAPVHLAAWLRLAPPNLRVMPEDA